MDSILTKSQSKKGNQLRSSFKHSWLFLYCFILAVSLSSSLHSQIAVIPAKLDLGTLGYSKASVWGASNMFSFEVINQSTNDVYVGPISFRPDRGNGYLLHGFNLWSEGVFGPLQKIQQTFYVHTTDTGTISGDLLIPFYSRSAGKHDTLAVPLTGTIAQLQTPFLTGFLKSDQITGRCGTKQLHATSPLSIDLVNPTNDTLQILDISPDSINGLEMRINELISVYDSVGVLVDRLKPLSGHKTTIPTVLLPTMPAHITVEPIQFWLPNSTATVRATLLRPNGDTITARSTIRFGYASLTQKLILIGPDRYPLYIRYNESDSTTLSLRAVFNQVPAEQLSLDQIVFRGPRSSQFSLISNDPTLPPVQLPLTMSCDSTIGRIWAGWKIRFNPTLPPGQMTDTIVALFSYRDSATGTVVRDFSWWTFETVVSAPLALPNSSPIIGTLRTYPNPASGTVTVELPTLSTFSTQSVRIDIVDITGRTVRSNTILQPQSMLLLNIHDLPNGYYTILLSDDKKRYWSGEFTVLQ